MTTHHQARLHTDLDKIRADLAEVCGAVRGAVQESVRGLLRLDRDRMYRVSLGDNAINRATRAIDADVHRFVARHIPAAGHLRFVSAVLRLTVALERIGDYAVTICRVGTHLEKPLPALVCDEIRALADNAVDMLDQATRAFLSSDADLARETMKLASVIDADHDRVFQEVVEDELDRSLVDRVGAITVIHQLERVSDQAKNVCELAVFAATGQTKRPKVYRVLFVDRTGELLAPLAEAIARRNHPESGDYQGAALAPAPSFDPRLHGLVEQLSLTLNHPAPAPMRPLRASPAEYHVLVAINCDWEELPTVPFHTIVIRWWIEQGGADDLAGAVRAVRALSARVTDLMEALRGREAQ